MEPVHRRRHPPACPSLAPAASASLTPPPGHSICARQAKRRSDIVRALQLPALIFCNNSSSYHPGGNIECTQTWAEGLLDGLMWSYRVDGTLEQSQMFVKGLLHGPSISYHTDGATVVRSLQFMHNLQVVAAAAAAAANAAALTRRLFVSRAPQDGVCQWFRSDGSRLSAAEYSYGKLHGVQTWYKADGHSIDYVEKYWNGERARMDADHVTAGGGSASGGRWTELEREQVKVLPREMHLPLPIAAPALASTT